MSGEIATRAQAYMTPNVKFDAPKSLPYVVFASKKADKYEDYAGQIPGLREPNPVLDNAGKYQKLIPFKFNLVEATQLWVERDQGRDALAVSSVRPAKWGGPLVEEIHAVVLVHTPDELIPASVTFKKGLCKGAGKAVAMLADVSGASPEKLSDWINTSDDHRAAAGITIPFARFTCTMTTQMAPSKHGGNPYPESNAVCKPTSTGDWVALQTFLDEDGFNKLDAVRELYNRRIGELLKLESQS